MHENLSNNQESQEKEYKYVNINTQHANMQQLIVNMIPVSCKQEENQMQISKHKTIDSLDKRTNTQTCY